MSVQNQIPTKIATFSSTDNQEIQVDFQRFTLRANTRSCNRAYEYSFDLGGHTISTLLCNYLFDRGPYLFSATIAAYGQAFKILLRFLDETGYPHLNAESYARFIERMKTIDSLQRSAPLREGSRRVFSNHVLKLMEWMCIEGHQISAFEVDIARQRHRRAWRGSTARDLERMRLKAVSPEDYARLLRAIRMEYEECRELLKKPRNEQDDYDGAFPLLPFSALLAVQIGVRPVEFNHLDLRDVRGERLLLNAPNKKPSEVALPGSLMASLELAKQWMLRYRSEATPDDPLLVYEIKGRRGGTRVDRFATPLVSGALARFYQKYFNLIAADGLPHLYTLDSSDESEMVPMSLSYADLRSAAITEAARHERNPQAIMRFARHAYFGTTLKYYIRETHRQWVTNVANFLAPSAELLRISLENRVAKDVEEKMAKASDAAVPGGHCEQALSGDRSCRRASDCRLCTFFRIHVSKREFFVMEREHALEQAQSLQTQEGLTRDAQNLREFAALNQAIIDRIDDDLAGRYPRTIE